MGPYRKGTGAIYGVELYQCPQRRERRHPAFTNMGVSANMRGPAYPQGVFGIESMMDDVAHRIDIDPLEFRLKNVTRKFRDETPYTEYSLETASAAAPNSSTGRTRRRRPAGDRPVR